MAEEWIVRVEGKEYGPVDSDALREWRHEGRLIPVNEVRLVGTENWIPAGELPEVFADAPPLTPPPLPRDFETVRTWPQIFADTFQIYRRGFVPFMLFGLLTGVPMFIAQWAMPRIPMVDLVSEYPDAGPLPALPAISVVMFLVVILVWPVSTAGFQLVADRILRGETTSFGAQFFAALHSWRRVLGAAILVYGSYFFWIFVPLTAMLAPLSTGNLTLVVLVILLVGVFMVYMNARLFINFLFWHQTSVLEENPPLIALGVSKELARSAPDAPPMDRPLYRGAIIASIWLLLLVGFTFGIHVSFIFLRVIGTPDPEQAIELAKKAIQAPTPDALMVAANVVVAAMNLLLRPLIAAAFVVLYHDARARAGNRKEEVESE